MSKIKIVRSYDDSDCDTCGSSYAEGFEVTVDGEPFGDYAPVAHCYGGSDYSIEQVFVDLLEHFGHKVEIGEE